MFHKKVNSAKIIDDCICPLQGFLLDVTELMSCDDFIRNDVLNAWLSVVLESNHLIYIRVFYLERSGHVLEYLFFEDGYYN